MILVSYNFEQKKLNHPWNLFFLYLAKDKEWFKFRGQWI